MGSDFYESLDEIRANLAEARPHIGIGPNTVINSAIVDKNVRIGSDVRLINRAQLETYDSDDGSFYIREGLIIVPKDSVLRTAQ